ncbi:diguanylate cyclase domain-containing protein [Butyrivibrio sp. AC2005]|uniref:diguanylate cyclase domain-containing protein n=1 Tax=Butyrivibrio sp. AC2005 TaxID=1280672 RepID=UPI000428AB7F|nr:diguanylate cyclase [Butyrivibrio sp. AC2005]
MKKLKSWQSWVLLAVCILINLIGRRIAAVFELPFWLDAIGTLIAAIQLGPLGGAISGAALNTLLGIWSQNRIANLTYIIVSVGIGVSVGFFFPKTGSHSLFRVISTAVFAGFVAVVLSTPLNIYFYDGRTGNIWGDGLIDMLSRDINVPVVCSFLGEAFVDIPDKALSVIVATKLIQIYYYVANRRKRAIRKSALLWFLLPAALCAFSINSKAVDMASEYAVIHYDTDDGLATMEINAIAQTKDGYLWVGTYAGLYRSDGHSFVAAELDERISNVMDMHVDRRGNLWIGTNDSGLACYNPKNNSITFYTVKDGLPSDSIRAICDDKLGNVYIGTATQLCVITKDGTIKTITDGDIYGVRTLTSNERDVVAGVTNSGELFFVRYHEFLGKTVLDDEHVVFTAVAAGEHEEFLVGSSSNYAVYATLEDGEIVLGKKYVVQQAEYFNRIIYSEQNNGFFCALEVGNGFLTREGKYTDMSTQDFRSSAWDVIVDYQGNIWFASNKQGIIKYSWNPFMDVFARAKIDSEVVNATMIKDGMLYVGTNNGLFTIDLKTYYSVPIDHPDILKNVKIKDLMEDSKGNVWVCTYGKNGLIELKTDGSVDTFNEVNKHTEGGRFRTVMEQSDGTIVAGSNTGLSFIKDGVVVNTIGEKDGLTTQVLDMVEYKPGVITVGTDGQGIAVVSDGKIAGIYGKEQGMESLVVLKVIPYDDDGSCIYVTSNALYYFKDEKVTKLTNFPYNDNYDVFYTDDGNAWVTSGAGIYIVNKADMIKNGDYSYSLLNKARGLDTSLTANARNTFDGKYLYLCCTDGVRRISVGDDNFLDRDYSIKISKLVANNEVIEPNEKGDYIIPATSGRITFNIAVLNYTLSNPMMHIFLEGSGDDGIICTQKEMQALSYINLPYGNYTLRVQVYDSAGRNVIREEKFRVMKESQIFERLYFKIYLFVVCVLFVLFIGWLVGNIRAGITSMERWQKEAKIDPMTKFWNKGFTEQFLPELCKNHEGILMIIDLDNFKLVNDIYGHEMGDKVLIKFAELIRSCLRDDDFIGRIGGDEFIAFIMETSEESAVAEKERLLNERIITVCEELMGKDMNIPTGVSIGAVATVDEGGDYADLFRKADKALYNVKQNGKHGYFMFRTSGVGVGDEVNVSGVAGIKMILEERGGVHKGAYLVDFEKLQMVYRLFVRIAKRTIVNIWIVQFILSREDGGEVEKEVMDNFLEVLSVNLRSNDVMAQNGKNQVILILTAIQADDGSTPINRILEQWNNMEGHEGYLLTYETEGME